jgi:hypothetical protein
MSRHHWSPRDHTDWQDLIEDAWLAGHTTQARLDALEELLAEARHAGRPWARDVERECLRAGLNREIVAHGVSRQPKVAYSYNGRVIVKPRRRGLQVRRADGAVAHQQSLWEELTWEEFSAVWAARARQVHTLAEELLLIERIAALQDRHPATRGVADALAAEGCSLDEWLAAA